MTSSRQETRADRAPANASRRNSEVDGALLFYSEFDDPKAWEAALKTHLPSLDFRVYPDVGNPEEVRYALVWKPFEGFFGPLTELSLVVNLGAGVDSIVERTDLPDVQVARLSDPGMIAMMKSYVLFAVIRYARDIPSFEQAQRRRQWHYIHPRPLDSIKVGVLGLGALGAAAAGALADLGFNVRGWDHEPRSITNVRCHFDPADWQDFLSEVEILVNMMPLTPLTRGAIDSKVFASLPRGAKFINASRGPVVNEPDLIEALRSGQIGGATLDVFTVEPLPPEHPFWTMENVLITPHLASITIPEAAAADVAESLRRVTKGLDPLNKVDVRKGY